MLLTRRTVNEYRRILEYSLYQLLKPYGRPLTQSTGSNLYVKGADTLCAEL